jgi:hypothetical protein
MKQSLRIAQSLSFAALGLVCALSAGAAAQSLDCDGAVVAAQESIDRTTANLTGMEAHMAAEELDSVHALLAVAGDYLGQAEATCATDAAAPYELAQGIAQASAARGYAEAADMLHFAYMANMSGMPSMSGMPGGM